MMLVRDNPGMFTVDVIASYKSQSRLRVCQDQLIQLPLEPRKRAWETLAALARPRLGNRSFHTQQA